MILAINAKHLVDKVESTVPFVAMAVGIQELFLGHPATRAKLPIPLEPLDDGRLSHFSVLLAPLHVGLVEILASTLVNIQ